MWRKFKLISMTPFLQLIGIVQLMRVVATSAGLHSILQCTEIMLQL